MRCSPLFEINNDISKIIEVYLKTIKNRKLLKDELSDKIQRSLIKKFNMDINNLRVLIHEIK